MTNTDQAAATVLTLFSIGECGKFLPVGRYTTTTAKWADVLDEGEVTVDHDGRAWILGSDEYEIVDGSVDERPTQTAGERAAEIGGLVATLYGIVAERSAQATREFENLPLGETNQHDDRRARAEQARGTLSLVSQAIVASVDPEVVALDEMIDVLGDSTRQALAQVAQERARKLDDVRAMLNLRVANAQGAYDAQVDEMRGLLVRERSAIQTRRLRVAAARVAETLAVRAEFNDIIR